jgi:general secretion pathway protein M
MALKLAKREKYIVSTGVCLVSLFFLFQLLIFPFFEKRDSYQKGIKVKESDLKEITVLSERYNKLKMDSMQMESILDKRNKGFTLFSFLERAAGEAKVKDHIKYMKPSSSKGPGPYKESLVEMKLENITLGQLVGYLYRIEKPEDLILVKRISINDNKKEEGYLDSIIQILTFQ